MLFTEAARESCELLRAEYQELPGLALSKAQARRLWSLDTAACDLLLDEMVNTRFLKKTSEELYVRVDAGW
jgi:hypothetical protein